MAAEHARRLAPSEAGETLIESLVAITILALVAIGAYAGLETAIRSTAQHKESAVAETLLRTAAERLQDPASVYIERAGCDGASDYSGLPGRVGYNPIDVSVSFWIPPVVNGSAPVTMEFAALGSAGDCPVNDPGLQKLELTITTPSGFTERLDVLKRRS